PRGHDVIPVEKIADKKTLTTRVPFPNGSNKERPNEWLVRRTCTKKTRRPMPNA
uniref:Uncharacterized protein n=1 Tax=Anopheles atroparvus TaxID=41427 RepID=A0AAG5DMT5_ANOAO